MDSKSERLTLDKCIKPFFLSCFVFLVFHVSIMTLSFLCVLFPWWKKIQQIYLKRSIRLNSTEVRVQSINFQKQFISKKYFTQFFKLVLLHLYFVTFRHCTFHISHLYLCLWFLPCLKANNAFKCSQHFTVCRVPLHFHPLLSCFAPFVNHIDR